MNLFELQRLKQEGKDVILPGGIKARDVSEEKVFENADQRIDDWIRIRRKKKVKELFDGKR